MIYGIRKQEAVIRPPFLSVLHPFIKMSPMYNGCRDTAGMRRQRDILSAASFSQQATSRHFHHHI